MCSVSVFDTEHILIPDVQPHSREHIDKAASVISDTNTMKTRSQSGKKKSTKHYYWVEFL